MLIMTKYCFLEGGPLIVQELLQLEKLLNFLFSFYKLKFASTKCYEPYTQLLLPQNSDQVQTW